MPLKRISKFFPTILILLFLFHCLTGSAFSMPPHPRILAIYQQLIEAYPHLSPTELNKRGINTPATYPDGTPVYPPHQGPSGSINAIALLVQFTDNPSSVGATFFDTLVFGNAPGTVRDYFSEISYGTLTIVTVNLPSAIGWQTAPQTYAYYVNGQNGFGSYPQNAQKLTEDAIALADSVVDFSNYDNDSDNYVDALFIIHAGQGAEWTGNVNHIWSHKWQTRTPQLVDGVYAYVYSMEPEYWSTPGDMTLGVYCHELGHVFGLPDWYDYGYDSRGVGRWCLMAGGSWNGTNGNSPAHVSAEGRWRLDFVSASVISSNTTGLAIPQVETNQSNSVFYVWDNGAANNEYWLLENRQQVGYDSALPGNGLMIWHIDDNKNGNDRQCTNHQNCFCPLHYEVALEQADGDLDLEFNTNSGDTCDPFPGSTNNTTFNLSSTPNSGSYADCDSDVEVTNISSSGPTMTADVQVMLAPVPEINVRFGGINFTDGSTRNLGTRTSSFIMGREFTFTIDNLGPAPLNLTDSPPVSLGGPQAIHFQVTLQPTSPVGAYSTTTFKLRTVRDSLPPGFPVGWTYPVSFTVIIPNDDSDENPYNFTIEFTLEKD
jgi:immune inhibitor A